MNCKAILKVLRCVTKAGRRALVKEILESELTREKIIGYVGQAIAYGINKGINAIPQDRRGTIHTSLELAHNATGRLLEVTNPESEEGFTVSPRETEIITDDLHCLTSNIFSGEVVEVVHAKIIERVP